MCLTYYMQYRAATATLDMTNVSWPVSFAHFSIGQMQEEEECILIAFVLDLNILLIWKVFTLHKENISSCVFILKQEDTKITWDIFWDSTYGHQYIA
jgi:hypothetical protein